MFWLCTVLAIGYLAGAVYCAANGVKCWSGVAMASFWLLLAWSHARRSV